MKRRVWLLLVSCAALVACTAPDDEAKPEQPYPCGMAQGGSFVMVLCFPTEG
jgi:hypothetical protein